MKSMTVRDVILDSLFNFGYQTNRQLAIGECLLTPSVRRTALQLAKEGLIEGSTGNPIVWSITDKGRAVVAPDSIQDTEDARDSAPASGE